MRAMSALASAIVTPGLSRATPAKPKPGSVRRAAIEAEAARISVGSDVDDAEALGHDADDLRGARFDRDAPVR